MTRTTAPSWTEAEDEWLRECYPLYSNAELAEFKALDGWPRDEQAIARRARTLGIRKDRSRGYVRTCRVANSIWTPERDAWFREFVPGHTEREIAEEHERLFGFPLRVGQIANRKAKLGVKSGTHGGRFCAGHEPANKGHTWDQMGMPEESRERCRATQFKRGNLPHNTRPLLDVWLASSKGDMFRQWEIHVGLNRRERANDQWIPLAQFNWMQANGRDWPDGCKALHIDRDPLNDDADNIEPVPVELWPLVMGAVRGQLEWHDRETLEAAITYARITKRRGDLARERRALEGHPWAQDVRKAAPPADIDSAGAQATTESR